MQAPQSAGQLEQVSPESHAPLPQKQSLGQLSESSPTSTSQLEGIPQVEG